MKKKRISPDLLSRLQGAIALHNQGRLDEADEIYCKVLREQPNFPDALHLRALVSHARGRYSEAARFAEAAIAAAPAVANFHNTAAEAWRQLGDLAKARRRLVDALRLNPAFAMAHHNLSLVLSGEGRHQDALASSRRALALNPGYCEALVHCLEIAMVLGDDEVSRRTVEQLQRSGDSSLARNAIARYHTALAREHLRQLRFADGVSEAMAAVAASAEFWGGWALLGEASNALHDDARAELYCTIAANLAPENENARLNIAHLLREQKRLEEAEAHYRGWLATHPDNAEARFGLAGIALMRGDYKAGWEDFEFRWKLPNHGGVHCDIAPQWRGDQADRLLLYAEQGLGDSLQMLRFLPEVVRRTRGTVVLLMPAPLARVAARAKGADGVSVVTEIPAGAKFDFACPLMSLPGILGVTSNEQFAMGAPYLAADPQRQAFFASVLSRHPGKKLGIVWRGGQAGSVNRRRALTEEALAPLLSLPGWTPVSLQFGVTKPVIAAHPLVDISAEIADFDDLAAAMTAVDVVVSLDTGPAHLAGALGVPTFTLVPRLHDWRWGLDGERSDWYPSMTLVRQATTGSWATPIQGLAARLCGAPDVPEKMAPEAVAVGSIEYNQFPFVRATCRHGSFVFPIFDRYVARSLLLYGEYSPREAEVLSSFLRPGDTAVDVGANLGTLSMALARAVGPQGKVLAFEPQGMIHGCLQETVARSDTPWVDARCLAIGEKAGVAVVPRLDATGASNFGGVADDGDGDPVDVVTLDGLALAACRLIKIDVEGRELEVLRGATQLLARCRPVICIECDRQGALTPLVEFLREQGYRVFRHEPPLFSPQNFRGCAHDAFPHVVSENILALPPGETPPTDARPIP